ncbi:hypothetical protein V0R52_01150 [Pseudomonas asiatica]|uniref:hypothetical protein n=1 Tax=Pseudomonas asiatica TaxID=2219225 RepID=UPI002E7C0CFA|nr:hypothetical protein [Pseudomonas asiatica]MEE1914990.1 hypothetical protein [Pseudomonas asiatica]
MALKLSKKPEPVGATKWLDYDKETKIEVAGLDSPEYQVALERARRRLRKNDEQFGQGDIGVISGEKTEHSTQCMLLANFILKDWSGAQDENGNPLKYSPDVGAQMLEGDVDFFLFVLKGAAEFSAESKQELEEIAGKPSRASSGSGNSAAKTRKSAQKPTDA